MIKGLLDYLMGRAKLKEALQDKEKVIEIYREEKNCITLENDFLKKEKDVLENEKNKQYQTIQELLGNEKHLKVEASLEAATQRAECLLKEVESWKDAALKADKDIKGATQKQNKRKKTPPSRLI